MAPTVTEDDNKRFQEWQAIQDWHQKGKTAEGIIKDYHVNERIKNRKPRDDDNFEYGTF